MEKLITTLDEAAMGLVKPGGEDLNFAKFISFRDIYKQKPKRLLIKAGRQTGKSNYNAVSMLTYSYVRKMSIIYLAPFHDQAKAFSKQKLADAIRTSPLISDNVTKQSVEAVEFKNGSMIEVNNISSTHGSGADKVRGRTADLIYIDELQDFDMRHMSVVGEITSSKEDPLSVFTGTTKTKACATEHFWENSNKKEWSVGCFTKEMMMECNDLAMTKPGYDGPIFSLDRILKAEGCGHANNLGLNNMGEKFLQCEKCKAEIFSQDGYWKTTGRPNAIYNGYRVPQIAMPLHSLPGKWDEMMMKISDDNFSEDDIKREILAQPSGEGASVITEEDLDALQRKHVKFYTHGLSEIRSRYRRIYAGIDWSGEGMGDENSFTFAVILGEDDLGDLNVISIRVWPPGGNMQNMLDQLTTYVASFNPDMIGADRGVGHWQNEMLARTFGKNRMLEVTYMGNTSKKYDMNMSGSATQNVKVDKVLVLDDLMLILKGGYNTTEKLFQTKRDLNLFFPDKSTITLLYKHILAEKFEINKMRRKSWTHGVNDPDDGIHALNFGIIAYRVFNGLISS